MTVLPPSTVIELQQRVDSIAGLTIDQVAHHHGLAAPTTLKAHKGGFGHLVEKILGANASSKPIPDFSTLGIELKTLPLNANGKPAESTFVSSISLTKLAGESWQTSSVKKKLSHVLWLPIEGCSSIPVGHRRIGQGIFWQPTIEQQAQLKQDYQELTDLIALGQLETISARIGEYLQIRPKAANGRSLTKGYNESGQLIKTLPRGFYLRTRFTATILGL